MTKKQTDTLIKNYQKKTDNELKEIAFDLVQKLESVNITDDELENYQEQIEALKTVLDTKDYEDGGINPKLYPLITDPNFNSKIYQNRQFNQFQITIDPEKSEEYENCNFTLTSSQRFLQSFMSPLTPYNSVLLFHGTGVGKTCSSLNIVEQFKPILEKTRKKIYVLVKQSIKESFLRNIFNIEKFKKKENQCLGDTYFKALGSRGIDWLQSGKYDQIDKSVKSLIKKKYKFMGYGEFSNFVKREEDNSIKGNPNINNHQHIKNKSLMNKFSDSIFIIDEVHNIGSDDLQNEKPSSHYIERVLKYSRNTKLVLLSATPMFDSSTEIISILNMLLINDNRPIIPRDKAIKGDSVTQEGLELISKYGKGYISYLRGEDPFKFPNRLYPDINDDPMLLENENIPNRFLNTQKKVTDTIKHFKLIGSEMSKTQSETYILKHMMELKDSKGDYIKYGVQDWPFQIANIVYPDNKLDVTSSRFDDYFNGDENNGFSYKKNVLEFLHPDYISEYSTKINTILNYIKNSNGIVYIYTRYLSDGAYPLAIALEHLGYKRYIKGKNSSSFLKSGKKEKTKKESYILLTGSSVNNEAIKKCISPENKNGEQIKIIIGTSASSEGIDFKNIREVHILDPWHNNNRLEQAIGRAIRFCSHMDLEREKRNTTIYYHVATLPGENTDVETADIYRYRESEKKAIEIGKIERLLKQISIDCHLNKSGNVYLKSVLNKDVSIITSQNTKTNIQLGDNEYSRICDFQKECHFDCLPEPDTNQLADYKIIPSHIEVQLSNLYSIVSLLNKLYKLDIIFDFNDIQKYINQRMIIDKYYLYLTLEKIINDKITITKNAIPGYIIYRGLYYIWQPSNYDENISIKNRNLLISNTKLSPQKRNLNNLIEDKISKSNIVESSLIIEDFHKAISKTNEISDSEIRNTMLLFFLNTLSEQELHKLIEHILVNGKKYSVIIELLADRIIYDKQKKIVGYVQLSSTDLVFIKYTPDKDIPFTPHNKEYSNKLLLSMEKTILTREKMDENILYSCNERHLTQRNSKGETLKIIDIKSGKTSGKKCVFFQKKDGVAKLVEEIANITTQQKIKEVFGVSEVGTKNEQCIYLFAILLYNDITRTDKKRWFYNEIEMFLDKNLKKKEKASSEKTSSSNKKIKSKKK
jgi:hypothetical protein